MAWSTPPTWTAGQTIPASNLNIIRDDLLETGPGKASATGRILVTTGPNAIAERRVVTAQVNASESTSVTSFTDLATAGPTISTLATGNLALVMWAVDMQNTGGANTRTSYEVSGATSTAAADSRGLLASFTGQMRATASDLPTLTPGNNNFQLKYRVTSSSGTFNHRHETVMAL